jgi:RNase P/RNase MRP subunit p29
MATATIQVAYEAETTSLKATVNEINQINDKVVQGAQDSAAKVKKEYTGIANSFAAAFSGGQAKKALDNQAKAIDNVGKSGKSLTGQLRGLKQELAQLELAGQDGTEAFNKLLISAAKLEDQIGDTRDRVKILASDTFKFDAAVGATQALASGFELAQGAAALFGNENEDLQEALVKITAATAVANGVQQLSSLIKEESAVKTAVLAARTSALTVATGAYNVVVGTTTGLMKALRIAFAATGIGALVIGLALLVENFDKVKQFAFNAIPGLEGFTNAVGKVIDETKKLLGIEDTKQQENVFEKLVTLENRKVKAKENAINRRIDLLKAENKDTTALEIEREQLLLNFANKKKTVIQANAAAIKTAGLDASETLFDLEQEILDKENAIQEKRSANRLKSIEEAKKAAEDQAKAREQLIAKELQLFESQLSAQDKIRSDSNNEVIELEKQFAAAKFKAGSAEELAAAKALADAIAVIRTNANKQIEVLDKQTQEKILAERLEAAKAAEGATLAQQLEALQNQQKIELENVNLTEAERLKIIQKYGPLIGKARADIADQALNDEINKLKTLEITEGSSLERREALIRAEGAKRVKAAGDDAEAIKLINAETDAAITEENKKETDKRINAAFEYAQAVTSLFSQLNELSKIASEQRIADITLQSEKELEAINASTELERDKERQRAALAKRTQQQISAEKTKQAKQDKALALFEIGVNTAKGIVSALGTTPPNPILAAFIAVTGALQLAAVAAKPIPKFERGGVVGGRLHSGGGTMVEAERDEYIINRRQSIRHRSELDAINSSSDAFRKLIEQRYVRPALMDYVAGNRNKQGVTVNASLNSKSMEKKLDTINRSLKNRNVIVNINQQDSRYLWQ